VADALVIAARTDPRSTPETPVGLFTVDVEAEGVIRTPRTSIGSTAMSHVRLTKVRVGASSRIDDGLAVRWPVVVRALDKATIVAAAELAGIARGALDAAVAYASEREQFGAPIATYQALAHRLADMAIDTDAAELAVEEAIDAPTPQNTSRSKIIANEAAHRVTAGLHQINGGVGFYSRARTIRSRASSFSGGALVDGAWRCFVICRSILPADRRSVTGGGFSESHARHRTAAPACKNDNEVRPARSGRRRAARARRARTIARP
jgi:alkylation response protein AidB-like acyl-CoA dehydrogenase